MADTSDATLSGLMMGRLSGISDGAPFLRQIRNRDSQSVSNELRFINEWNFTLCISEIARIFLHFSAFRTNLHKSIG